MDGTEPVIQKVLIWRQYAVQSANEATTDSVIAEQHQYEFETLLSLLSDIAESAKFGGK